MVAVKNAVAVEWEAGMGRVDKVVVAESAATAVVAKVVAAWAEVAAAMEEDAKVVVAKEAAMAAVEEAVEAMGVVVEVPVVSTRMVASRAAMESRKRSHRKLQRSSVAQSMKNAPRTTPRRLAAVEGVMAIVVDCMVVMVRAILVDLVAV